MVYRTGFKRYLDDLGKRNASAGGGSAACLIFCSGASLIEKAINFSPPFKFKKQLRELQALRRRIFPYIDRDGVIFAEIMRSKGKKRERWLRLSENLLVDLGRAALGVFSLAKDIESGIKKSIISDFEIGLECVKTALLGSILNLEANQRMFARKSKFIKPFKKSLKKWR
jgi:formiminotetrahydrofolate cyclodeaminase